MTEAELDSILGTVENLVRRRIIERLTREPGYELQLSKELGFSQQLVAKHLDSMENAGVVTAMIEESPRGPRRKEYLLSRSVFVNVDFAPNLFRAKVLSFRSLPETGEISDEGSSLVGQLNEILRYPEAKSRISPLVTLITAIDRRLKSNEEEKTVLLYLRSLTMGEVGSALAGIPKTIVRKRVIYHLIGEHGRSIQRISKYLNVRETSVRNVVTDLEREFLGIPA